MTLNANEYLIPELEPLRQYLNTTWKGKFVGTEKPTYDIQHWERILNGTHMRIMHSLNDGKMKSKAYFFKNGKWVDGHEIVYEKDPEAELIFK
jgi:hypothetical protein